MTALSQLKVDEWSNLVHHKVLTSDDSTTKMTIAAPWNMAAARRSTSRRCTTSNSMPKIRIELKIGRRLHIRPRWSSLATSVMALQSIWPIQAVESARQFTFSPKMNGAGTSRGWMRSGCRRSTELVLNKVVIEYAPKVPPSKQNKQRKQNEGLNWSRWLRST